MDASTAVIIALFVVTIISSFGGVSQPVSKPSKPALPPGVVRQVEQPVNPRYSAVPSAHARSSIKKFILKYRKAYEADQITNSIMTHAKTYDVNPKLVAALMVRESRFNPRAVSSAGALGLGQLMPATAKSLKITNAFDIDQNAKGTVRYMSYLLGRFKKYGKQISFALAGYLEGPNAVARKKGYRASTGKYVKDILNYYNKI
jgi:soluble lytic murein transglycosylase-like protein